MERNKFNEKVIECFSEIKDQYFKAINDEWDGEEMGSTILLEDYLIPYLYKNIDNKNLMNKLSNFLEDIICLNDEYCNEVLYSSFFEKIHYDNLISKFIDSFKEKTLDFYNNLKF